MEKKAVFYCSKCKTPFVFFNYIPEKVICLNCGAEYSGQELLKVFREYEECKIKYEK